MGKRFRLRWRRARREQDARAESDAPQNEAKDGTSTLNATSPRVNPAPDRIERGEVRDAVDRAIDPDKLDAAGATMAAGLDPAAVLGGRPEDAELLDQLMSRMREIDPELAERIADTVSALQRTVRSANLAFDDVSRVLLVGGTSRIPLIGEMVHEATGLPTVVDTHPKHAIALGAAAHGATPLRAECTHQRRVGDSAVAARFRSRWASPAR